MFPENPPELIKLCEEGGFSLTKFVSNSAEVLKSIPEEKKASTAQIEKEICASFAHKEFWPLRLRNKSLVISINK